jgi:hypothetical protein
LHLHQLALARSESGRMPSTIFGPPNESIGRPWQGLAPGRRIGTRFANLKDRLLMPTPSSVTTWRQRLRRGEMAAAPALGERSDGGLARLAHHPLAARRALSPSHCVRPTLIRGGVSCHSAMVRGDAVALCQIANRRSGNGRRSCQGGAFAHPPARAGAVAPTGRELVRN